ncbi:MAG: FAD-dependent oxidoreductase, partial [Acidimicrobiales bacterium]
MGEGWDHEVDLLVAGSGAGGLTAALAGRHAGLDTLVIEKASVYGGSTALSGGGIWIPNNPELRRRGRGDDPAEVLTYLHAIVGDRVPAARVETFARAGAEAMEFLEASSPHLRFSWCQGYADYHPEAPGGRPLGRSIEALPFDMRRLGADEPRLRRGLRTPGGAWMTASDFHDLTMMRRTWTGRRALLRMAGRVLTNLVRRRHMVTLGGALIGRMRLAVSDAGIPLWL